MLQSLADSWWAWVVLGFALGVMEVLVPGYIFVGFAIGAVLTGGLVGFGLAPTGLAGLILVFSLASLVAWLVLRQTLGVRKGQAKIWDRDINEN
jgi:inner membrane protein